MKRAYFKSPRPARRVFHALIALGYTVHFEHIEGGHKISWKSR